MKLCLHDTFVFDVIYLSRFTAGFRHRLVQIHKVLTIFKHALDHATFPRQRLSTESRS